MKAALTERGIERGLSPFLTSGDFSHKEHKEDKEEREWRERSGRKVGKSHAEARRGGE